MRSSGSSGCLSGEQTAGFISKWKAFSTNDYGYGNSPRGHRSVGYTLLVYSAKREDRRTICALNKISRA
jgi:hypothetical protein